VVTEAFALRNHLLSGSDDSIEAMSGRLGMKCRLISLIRLSHLAPEILGALLAGRHPIEPRLWIDRVAGTILAIFGVRELYRAL
jgi:hypothetical protein